MTRSTPFASAVPALRRIRWMAWGAVTMALVYNLAAALAPAPSPLPSMPMETLHGATHHHHLQEIT